MRFVEENGKYLSFFFFRRKTVSRELLRENGPVQARWYVRTRQPCLQSHCLYESSVLICHYVRGDVNSAITIII